MKQELSKRLSSLAWSISMMMLAMIIDWSASNIALFNLEPEMTVFLGLFLAQMSKAIHNYIKQFNTETV